MGSSVAYGLPDSADPAWMLADMARYV